MTQGESDEILKKLTERKMRSIDLKKAKLAKELDMMDEILNAYWDGVYDALKAAKERDNADAHRAD